MREILFRGKRKDNAEWVYGNFVRGCVNDFAYIVEFGNKELCRNYVEVIPSTIGQYTGLTDKNGTKIFEGDILSIAQKSDWLGTYYFPPLKYPANVFVKWDMCGWLWETICKDKYYLHFPDAWCHFECEVIGNIHDNPELMKGGVDNG